MNETNTQQEIQTKKCSKCGEVKPIEAFHRKSCSPDGLQSYCKDCQCAAQHKSRYEFSTQDCNPLLAEFSTKTLLAELRARGARGTLTFSHEVVL